jgi:protein ImuA
MTLPASLSDQVFRLGRAAAEADLADRAAASGFPFGLSQSGIHEVAAQAYRDYPALAGFALGALGRGATGAVVWIAPEPTLRDQGRISAAALQAMQPGLSLLNVSVRKPGEALWAAEETIRSGAARLVVAEARAADFTATRRLSLASQRHGVALILLMPQTCEGATAAQARWRVAARPSSPNRFDPRAPGHTRWQAVLERCRTAPASTGKVFDVEFDHETLSFSVVPGLAARPAEAEPPRRTVSDTTEWRQTG